MQHVEIKIELVSPLGLPSVVSLPKGSTKTGDATRFACVVISNGESTSHTSVAAAWEALGFHESFYGFGSRVQIQVARDGLAMVEHKGSIYTFAKVSA